MVESKLPKTDLYLSLIGDFGRFQLTCCVLSALTIFLHCWQMLLNKFYTFPVDHWCSRPLELQEMPVQQWINLSAPMNGGEFDKCQIFDVEFTNMTARPSESTPTRLCDSWEYDNSVFQVRMALNKIRMMRVHTEMYEKVVSKMYHKLFSEHFINSNPNYLPM